MTLDRWLQSGSRLLCLLPPETAHKVALFLLQMGTRTRLFQALTTDPEDPILAVRLWERDFQNPLGLAAGFDKDAKGVDALLGLGFSFIEVGTVTPRPQWGNARPRLFRLPADKALINRMGFNNDGLAKIMHRLVERQQRQTHDRRQLGWIGVNLGCNRDSPEAIADYVEGVRTLAPLADYLVLNVSSPNTDGLRRLQDQNVLTTLIRHVRDALYHRIIDSHARPPILVKIAPDLTHKELSDIATVALASGLDGFIATNTTLARPLNIRACARAERGGLSGRPLFSASTAVLAEMYQLTKGKLPLIGVGGVFSGADALAKIKAGASLVQVYTAMIYEGPGIVRRIKKELAQLLRDHGYRTVSEAVGTGVSEVLPGNDNSNSV
ncbi:Dihydroorotate dehydrogenase [invertebrate metagenome]|uniref:dihydroorotate dehydrogenase (quinone) n=1 Tax=invertebrate metagenome TaxID=1711999 RepID=A0A484H4X2_9ZZZZ